MSAWQPTCGIQQLRLRAQLLAFIRQFFAQKQVLEVETPLLCHATGTDPFLDFFTSRYGQTTLFLQTSPEFAMKRLLAAGSGSIYQICKAFRKGEAGRFHNSEFTMLEWYRVDFNLAQLMDEVAELLTEILSPRLPEKICDRVSYVDIFQQLTGLNPLVFCCETYQNYAQTHGLPEAAALCGDDASLWLDLLFSHQIQPQLGLNKVCLVYDYPAILPSLARTKVDEPLLTERFEIFVNGLELGNGFFELADADEQERRFDAEIVLRQQQGLPSVTKDEHLLAALRAGLPVCSGVAMGLDRLLMLLDNSATIHEILTFPQANA